jgi:methylated-DNA-[protein]-cysteine S-methyltransferase
MFFSVLDSPVGELLLVTNGEALTAVSLAPAEPEAQWRKDDALLRPAREQLAAYFVGDLQEFKLSLAPEGTAFQQRVWNELRQIRFGQTTSYGEIARRLGQPGAARPVGAANGRNPVAIIVPCHRVIGSNGTLTGYGGGLDRKQWLLRHEAEVLARSLGDKVPASLLK